MKPILARLMNMESAPTRVKVVHRDPAVWARDQSESSGRRKRQQRYELCLQGISVALFLVSGKVIFYLLRENTAVSRNAQCLKYVQN